MPQSRRSAKRRDSRGAFYSNFDDKEQVFLAVIDRRRPKAIDDMLQHSVDVR